MVMGVAGAGKTTLGLELSRMLGWEFVDADSLHSPENIEKMHAGIPLTDVDRKPWLEDVARRIQGCLSEKRNCVFACSALKESYRRTLIFSPEVRLVYLAITPELAQKRVAQRTTTHFMPPSLVESQLADLESPKDAIVLDGGEEPEKLVKCVVTSLGISWKTLS